MFDINVNVAITTLLLFLYKNNKWLKVDAQDLYVFTVRVAESKPEDKNFVVAAVRGLITDGMVNAQ